jgi:hypothetical protein
VQTDGVDHVIFDVRNNGSNVFQIYKSSASILYGGWITAGSDRRVSVVSGSYTLNQNAWNSLVLTWDTGSGNAFLYLNNVQIGTMSAVTTFTSTATRYIGNFSGLSLDARGAAAEVTICDRVWSANERTAYHAGILPHALGAVDGYWPLWGGDSSEQDLSSNGNTGTVTGAVRFNHPPVQPFGIRGWGSLLEEISSASNATLTAAAAAATWTGQAAAVATVRTVAATAAAGSWVAQVVARLAVARLAGGPAVATWTGQAAPVVPGGATVTATAAAGSWVAQAATVTNGILLAAGAAVGSWVAQAATRLAAVTVTAAAPAGSWVAQPAVPTSLRTLTATAAAATWSALTVSLSLATGVPAGPASASWLGQTATVLGGDVVEVVAAVTRRFFRRPGRPGFWV